MRLNCNEYVDNYSLLMLSNRQNSHLDPNIKKNMNHDELKKNFYIKF